MKRLQTAIMGLGGIGEECLAAIRSDERFDLVAMADADPEVLRRHQETTSARTYRDYRSLIVESARDGLDVLVVALEPFESIEFVEMAAERGIGIFHKPPFARNVREAQRLQRCLSHGDSLLVVSRFWQFERAFAPLNQLTERIGCLCAATATVRTTETPIGWRGDSVRAGGGVLLHGAYEAVDLLVHCFGLPETVFARCTTSVARGSPRNYDTEDVAAVILGFSNERVGCVTAMRGAAKPSWHVTLQGTLGTVELSRDRVIVTTRKGDRSESRTVRKRHPVLSAISAFAASRLSGDPKIASVVQEHLLTTAVIEAAYLSATTGAPESPRRLLG